MNTLLIKQDLLKRTNNLLKMWDAVRVKSE